jgi:cytidine deaminase
MNDDDLVSAALNARNQAYSPYSQFAVGAALLDSSGNVFVGCNVENISFGLTMCAERVALGSAISAGSRKFTCIAIASDSKEPVSPCGACRQVLAEFAPNLRIVSANLIGNRAQLELAQLLPRASTGILG